MKWVPNGGNCILTDSMYVNKRHTKWENNIYEIPQLNRLRELQIVFQNIRLTKIRRIRLEWTDKERDLFLVQSMHPMTKTRIFRDEQIFIKTWRKFLMRADCNYTYIEECNNFRFAALKTFWRIRFLKWQSGISTRDINFFNWSIFD